MYFLFTLIICYVICKRSYDILRLRFFFFVSLSFRFFIFWFFGRCFGINQLIRASIRARISSQWVFADWVNRSRYINHSNVEWKAQQKTKMLVFIPHFLEKKTIYAERITIIEIDDEWNWFFCVMMTPPENVTNYFTNCWGKMTLFSYDDS